VPAGLTRCDSVGLNRVRWHYAGSPSVGLSSFRDPLPAPA
jgi:hypothetical protein